MTIGGWIVMISLVGGMTGLTTWCITKVLRTPGSSEHLHTQADVEPPDTYLEDPEDIRGSTRR
jgi:hypothetical protein